MNEDTKKLTNHQLTVISLLITAIAGTLIISKLYPVTYSDGLITLLTKGLPAIFKTCSTSIGSNNH